MADVPRVKWTISGDELQLTDEKGVTVPSAKDIYESIFEKKPVFDHVPPGKPENLRNYEFSKFPADLRIDLDYRSSGENTGFYCELKAAYKKKEQAVSNFRTRKSDHILIENTWYPFAEGALGELCGILDEEEIENADDISFKDFLALKKVAQTNENLRDLTLGQIVQPGINFRQTDDALGCFEGKLYPYQKIGWQWLSFLCQERLGGILADEMGLGKTVQVIAALSSPVRENMAPSLIVAPGTLLENWRREFLKFSPELTTFVHRGSKRTAFPSRFRNKDVVIASYDTVKADHYLFDMVEWKVVVLDEAQNIKNPETQRACTMKNLKRNVSIAVTGTPMENSLSDIWSIMDFVHPGYLGSLNNFESRFVDGPEGGAVLEPFISPLMLRRRIDKVAKDLPERIHIPQILQLSESEARQYEEIRKEICDEHGNQAGLVSLMRLRQYCTHPLLLKDLNSEPRSPAEFGKFQRLLEIAEEVFKCSEKILVFTSYQKMADLIVSEVSGEFKVHAARIDGRDPPDERQEIIDRFEMEDGPALLAINYKAGGTGLNITAANHVILYNLEWNPATEDQAIGRAYRKGQKKPVTVHRLVFADTVEEAIDQRLERKRDTASAAVVGVTGEEQKNDILSALQRSPVKN